MGWHRTFLTELVKTIPVEQMISWTLEPKKVPTMTFGKHRGAKWSDIPIDYLQWMLRRQIWTRMQVGALTRTSSAIVKGPPAGPAAS